MHTTLTMDQVDNFLTNVLNMPDWKSLLQRDKLQFLKTYQRQSFVNIYFHNIRMISREEKDRKIPTLEQVIQVGLAGAGGVCNEVNTFTKIILESLGFDAYHIGGDVYNSAARRSHVMTVVRFSPNEQYLLDMASANPLEEPVPLHQLPYKGIAAGFPYEYRVAPDGDIRRYQCGGSFMNGAFADADKEQERFRFTLEKKYFNDFDEAMRSVYTDSEKSAFLSVPFLFRYLEFTETHFKFVLVRGTNVMIATKHTREVKQFANFDEMKPEIEKLFSRLVKAEVDVAWKTFNDVSQKENIKKLANNG